ncbi:hypothetical protein L249_6494 [Ophiocordyceps polyrhachis-furcata BCC 54312]|uniref:Uncharacterized protein n=1 Tax=Ophiocordyceps polyrhachis-furcata BCC 54312 TaxID=1330021 RepID=A0A367LK81_9HYPO|nr:hypothetical protein L249_6494 [Ophiocordyceps polyrhachis-furcata BCC 54312]
MWGKSSVGKVESNEVFCGAVEEEEGGEKLVESVKVSRVRELNPGSKPQKVIQAVDKELTNRLVRVNPIDLIDLTP